MNNHDNRSAIKWPMGGKQSKHLAGKKKNKKKKRGSQGQQKKKNIYIYFLDR